MVRSFNVSGCPPTPHLLLGWGLGLDLLPDPGRGRENVQTLARRFVPGQSPTTLAILLLNRGLGRGQNLITPTDTVLLSDIVDITD